MVLQSPETAPTSVAPNSAGLDEDVPCPKCEYNLRGLTVPRCPECGFRFAWSDIPRWREEKGRQLEWGAAITGVLLWIPFVFCVLLAAGGPNLEMSAFILIVAGSLLLSAAQAVIEIGFGLPLIGAPGWHRFRAWWEGVLIGYGLCAFTVFRTGHLISFFEWDCDNLGFQAWLWPLWLLTAFESLAVQWWVVRWRMRYWGEPIRPMRLLLACLLAKAVIAAAWSFCPFRIVRI